jgi:hypothetical protein
MKPFLKKRQDSWRQQTIVVLSLDHALESLEELSKVLTILSDLNIFDRPGKESRHF